MRRIALALAALLLASLVAYGQAVPNTGAIPFHYLTLASANPVLVKGSIGNVYGVTAINTTTTVVFLKFYDKATAPTCGTDTPVQTLPVPFGSSSSGGGFTLTFPFGMQFYSGIGFCVTGAIADNDSSAAVTGIAINLNYR